MYVTVVQSGSRDKTQINAAKKNTYFHEMTTSGAAETVTEKNKQKLDNYSIILKDV